MLPLAIFLFVACGVLLTIVWVAFSSDVREVWRWLRTIDHPDVYAGGYGEIKVSPLSFKTGIDYEIMGGKAAYLKTVASAAKYKGMTKHLEEFLANKFGVFVGQMQTQDTTGLASIVVSKNLVLNDAKDVYNQAYATFKAALAHETKCQCDDCAADPNAKQGPYHFGDGKRSVYEKVSKEYGFSEDEIVALVAANDAGVPFSTLAELVKSAPIPHVDRDTEQNIKDREAFIARLNAAAAKARTRKQSTKHTEPHITSTGSGPYCGICGWMKPGALAPALADGPPAFCIHVWKEESKPAGVILYPCPHYYCTECGAFALVSIKDECMHMKVKPWKADVIEEPQSWGEPGEPYKFSTHNFGIMKQLPKGFSIGPQ